MLASTAAFSEYNSISNFLHDSRIKKETLHCRSVPTSLRFTLDTLSILKHIAEIKLLLFMLETHLHPSGDMLTFNIKTKLPSVRSPVMLFSSGLLSSSTEQMKISCPLYPMWHTSFYFRPDWLCLELQLLFFFFFFFCSLLNVCAISAPQCNILHFFHTPTQTHWDFHFCVLHAFETWLFQVTRVMSTELTKLYQIIICGEKQMTHSCTQGFASTIVYDAFRTWWCKQSWFENIIAGMIAVSGFHRNTIHSETHLYYHIQNTPHNQTSVTKELMGISTSCGLGWAQTDGTSGRDRCLLQKASAACGTKHPEGTYGTRLTLGDGKTLLL